MADVRVFFDQNGRVSITLENQHISRMTHVEARSMLCSLLVFGGKELREEIKGWLNGGKIEQVAEVIAPEEQSAAPRP